VACHGQAMLRRENIRGSVLVPAPALSYKHVSASYGREVIQFLSPSPCSGHYARYTRGKARWRSPLKICPSEQAMSMINCLAEIYHSLSSIQNGF